MTDARRLNEPFADTDRQVEADRLGMLIFLASELMLFGGIFGAALALRLAHPQEFLAASANMKLWHGTLNTAILLTSSLFAAIGVECARAGNARGAGRALWAAVVLGIGFLGVKAHEYWSEWREGALPGFANAQFESPVERLFANLYLAGTGLHAIHVTIGLTLLAVAALRHSARADRQAVLIGNAALFWHLVDVIWVFLYPTLYLAGVGE